MWCVVHFTVENTVEVVPCLWIINENLCYWPGPTKGSEDLRKLIKKQFPPEKDWLRCSVRVLGTQYDSLKRAREKCKQAESTSDINSEIEASDGDSNRQQKSAKCKSVRFPSPTSQQSNTDKSLDEPNQNCQLPSLVSDFENMAQRNSMHEKPSGGGSASQARDSIVDNLAQTTSPDPQISNNGNSIREIQSVNFSPSVEISDMPNITWKPSSGFEKYVYRTLQILEQVIISMAERNAKLEQDIRNVQFSCKSSRTEHEIDKESHQEIEADSLLAWFPLQRKADIQMIESKLKDKSYAEKLIAQLQLVGGSSAKECVVRLLRLIFADKLAAQYNWLGLKGKETFSTLTLRDIIFKTIRKRNYNTVTDKEIEDHIKDWLRHAPARTQSKPKKTATATDQETNERVHEADNS